MYDHLREKALINIEKKRKKKRSTQIIGVIFGSIATVLFIISLLMSPSDRLYMMIPISILGLTYLILYTILNGFPFISDEEITEEEIDMEMIKIYRKSKIAGKSSDSNEAFLKLKDLEKDMLESDFDEAEDYV